MPELELNRALSEFRDGLDKGRPILELQGDFSHAVDSAVDLLATGSKQNRKFAIFALGSYGRREMSPYSDIDLMVLHEDGVAKEEMKGLVDGILYPLWDLKMDAGGATRSVAHCRELFGRRERTFFSSGSGGWVKAQSALLDARLVTGDRGLAEGLFDLIEKEKKSASWTGSFIAGKYREYRDRIEKFQGSVYMLEPHVKEGKGGLRELQAFRCLRSLNGNHENHAGTMRSAEFLFRVRAWLHFLAGKREDRLTFENQKAVAAALRISPDELMNIYYHASSSIHRETRAVMDGAAPFLTRMARKWEQARIKRIVGSSPSWQRIAANPDVLAETLLMLHDSQELKRMFPSFESIYFRSQFGAYHVYTVDIHSILAVRKVIELGKKDAPPLLRDVYNEVKDKGLLYLAALLHDIGKGSARGGSHTKSGAVIAREEALRLGYGAEEAEKVAFLISSHLIMPHLAFSRDLADPLLIENFAESVDDIELLRMLYILAYADIASIGPDVWNAWKDKLLSELYLLSKRYLEEGGAEVTHRKSEKMKRYFSEKGDALALEWLTSVPERYFSANSREHIAGDIELYRHFLSLPGDADAVVRHGKSRGHSEFLVMTRDAPGIFSKIAGVMSANNVSILHAELNTSKRGIVLDRISVVSEVGRPVTEQMALKIELALKDALAGRKEPAEMLKKRSALFRQRGVGVETKVEVDNDVSVYYTVVDIYANDRVGLLYDLGRAFYEHGTTIELAKIMTKADAAVDAFYIKNFDGTKISDPAKLAALKEGLVKACGQ